MATENFTTKPSALMMLLSLLETRNGGERSAIGICCVVGDRGSTAMGMRV
ncbi:hypothetical protein CCHR01_10735 [Colletotrichum chrysophilum]|uniref:Uncharacterized protein n=1 Tax=Colletotrichum chrysophilum TaxID=1836956 RepID=A0AAD9AG09_9PEZI|nr:hypothetical protein CCHR01_10735 [Colletotrichum chrysophilum]